MSDALIALGSNLGRREFFLDRALERLRAEPGMRLLRASSYFETAPVGGPPGQESYLNAAALIETNRFPSDILQFLMSVEASFGRIRSELNAPRTLDLDLVLHDKTILHTADLILPHPRMHQRRFVLEPINEIAPEFVHPGLGRTVAELLKSLPSEESPPRIWHRPRPDPATQELRSQTVVVTGSSSGIGRATALELARAGARVVLHGREKSRDNLRRLANEIRTMGSSAEILIADLGDQLQLASLVEAAWAIAPIDAWINNAGADTLTGEAGKWSFERKLTELFEIDLMGTMILSRLVGTRMKARGAGVILTTGWDQAHTGMEGDSGELFAAIKGGIMDFTRSLAKSLAPTVRVNALAPGWIRTAWGETASDLWQERVRRETPLGRWGLPEDVARTARWLIGPNASFTTGQIVRINGGVV